MSNLSVLEIIDLFLEWCRKNRDRLTYEAYRRRLQSPADGISPAPACDELKPYRLTRITDAKGWNSTTKNDFIGAVPRAFNLPEDSHFGRTNFRGADQTFQRRLRELLLPPLSAVISSRRGFQYRFFPS